MSGADTVQQREHLMTSSYKRVNKLSFRTWPCVMKSESLQELEQPGPADDLYPAYKTVLWSNLFSRSPEPCLAAFGRSLPSRRLQMQLMSSLIPCTLCYRI